MHQLWPPLQETIDYLSYRELARLVHWVRAHSLQLCLTLCSPMDCSPPGSSIHRILQARILEWVATPSTGDLLNRMIKSKSPALAGRFLTTEPPGKSNSSPLVPGNSRNWRKVWWERRGKTARPAQTQALQRTRAMHSGSSWVTSNIFCLVHTVLIFFFNWLPTFLKIKRYLLNFVISGFPWKIRKFGSTEPVYSHGSQLTSSEWQWLHWLRCTSSVFSMPDKPCSPCYTYIMYVLLHFHIMDFLMIKEKVKCSLYPKQRIETTMCPELNSLCCTAGSH